MKAITSVEEFFEYRGIEKGIKRGIKKEKDRLTKRLVKNLIKESNGKLSHEQALEKAKKILSED